MSMIPVYDTATHLFDAAHAFWESNSTRRAVASLLVVAFLAALAGIEANRQGLLPASLAGHVPLSHFQAVGVAFTLVLILEVLGLIFVLPCSVSKSVGKQLEILSLILLRDSFKELTHFTEPIDLAANVARVLPILSDGAGALAIFVLLGVYYRIIHKGSAIKNGQERYRFVATKKLVALFLLAGFLTLGGHSLFQNFAARPRYDFFETYYTILVFSDILLVLISNRFLPAFHGVFRNSGYALSTLLMRLALTAPPFYNALIGLAAALFAVGITMAFNAFSPSQAEPPPSR